MKAKQSKELELLITTTKTTSRVLVETLINTKIIEDSTELYGLKVSECIDGEMKLSDFVEIMALAGVPGKCKYYDAIMNLVLIGNGDCPECGGEMEVMDADYKRVGGDGYNTPFEYKTIWETKKCTNCGCVESDEPNLED